MYKYLFLIFAASLLSGCYCLKVEKLSEAEKVKDFPLVYVLPKTALRIEVEVEKTTGIPGPYKKYAEELLGVKSFIKEDFTNWDIISVNIVEYPVPDTSSYFLIKAPKNSIAQKMQLTREGFLVSLNRYKPGKIDNSSAYALINNIDYPDEKYFEELPVKKITKVQYDTIYKVITTDTTTRRIPSYKKFLSLKSEDELAKDASDFIIRIRKRRAKYMMGIYKVFPESETFEAMFREMNRVEKEYLSLFLGLENKEKQVFTFDYIPQNGQKNESTVLFRLSKQKGVLDKSASEGIPVMLSLNSMQNTSPLDSLYSKNSKLADKNKGLKYRIPANTMIKISMNKETIAEKVCPIAQYGRIHSLSVKSLKKANAVLFYPELGNIKSIE